MKNLNLYIKESLLDDEDELIDASTLTVDMVYDEFERCGVLLFPKKWLKINEKTDYVDIYSGESSYVHFCPTSGAKLPHHIIIGDVHGFVCIGKYSGSNIIDSCWFPKRCYRLRIGGLNATTYNLPKSIEIDSNLGPDTPSFGLYGQKSKLKFDGKCEIKFTDDPGEVWLDDIIITSENLTKIKFTNCNAIYALCSSLNENNITKVEKQLTKSAKNLNYLPILDETSRTPVFEWDKKDRKYKYII